MTSATKVKNRPQALAEEVAHLETAAAEVAAERENAAAQAAKADRRLDQLLGDQRTGGPVKEGDLHKARATAERAAGTVRDGEAAFRAIEQRLADARSCLADQRAADLRSKAEAIANHVQNELGTFAAKELEARDSAATIGKLGEALIEAAAACAERLDLGDFGSILREAFGDPEHSPSRPALADLREVLLSLDGQIRALTAQRRAA